MADEIKELQNTLIAKKLARFVPSSISIDDIKISKNKSESNDKNQKKLFIPPSPSVSVITAKNEKERTIPSSASKFAFLLGNKPKKPKKSTSMSKMKYELPNVQKIGVVSNGLRPVLAISVSSLNLKNEDSDLSKKKKKNEGSSKVFMPDATQIDSDVYDSDSDSYTDSYE